MRRSIRHVTAAVAAGTAVGALGASVVATVDAATGHRQPALPAAAAAAGKLAVWSPSGSRPGGRFV
jgi:hypothetical protein